MFLNYFNLKKEPFNITPDPEMLYLSPCHKEALAAIVYGVNKRKGFIAITGEVGVGKTTIIRSFLDRIDTQKIRTIYVFNAQISFSSLLTSILQNMGSAPESGIVSEMVNQIHLLLIEEYRAGRNVVLIIDEAQNMPVSTLESLRMLSNLETCRDKLIQIVFSGQPEFEDKLRSWALRQLSQRIAIRVRVAPLSTKDSLAYIRHRLAKSGSGDQEIFTNGALKRIVRKSAGIPRIINILCDNCLITSFGKQQKLVTGSVVNEIIRDLSMDNGAHSTSRTANLVFALLLACFFLILLNFGAIRNLTSKPIPGIGAKTAEGSGQGEQLVPQVSGRGTGQEVEMVADKDTPLQSQRNVRVVKQGDTLARLIVDTYGTANSEILEMVKRGNSWISDVNKIQEGEEIYFPAIAK